jgi:hypothetical protein
LFSRTKSGTAADQENIMAKSPTEQIEEIQAKELLQDMQETKEATEAADEGVSGPEKKPGDRGFKTIEEEPELLAQYQDPHGQSTKKPAMAWFKNAYGQPVLGPL